MQLDGARVLVTGANRGLGLHFVRALLARGADRVYAASRNPDTLVPSSEHRVVAVHLDVTDASQVSTLPERLPDVDVVISNAGQACAVPVLDAPDETVFRSVFDVNFFGPLTLARSFSPQLRHSGGGILFVLSLAGLVISRSSPIYSASKAAGMMLSAGLRSELAADGVIVTSTYPGFIDTDMTAGADMPKASPRSVADRTLDGFAAGAPVVFPDALAELVGEAVRSDMNSVLADPQAVMTRLIKAHRAAGSA